MHTLVRKTLEIYLRERRVITQTDIPSEVMPYLTAKDAVFVTLYHHGRVIASSGRIQCQKENSVYECIDNTLLCLKDTRFEASLQDADTLSEIHIRVDMLAPSDRRVLQNIADLNIRDEGVMLLSQNLGVLSIVLPRMLHIDTTPERYFALVCQKAGLDTSKLVSSDYVLYAIKTKESTDMTTSDA